MIGCRVYCSKKLIHEFFEKNRNSLQELLESSQQKITGNQVNARRRAIPVFLNPGAAKMKLCLSKRR